MLPLSQNGLQIPDHVTLVWPDDSFGYIRQLSTQAEQRRSGGAGVYDHISYWGAPAGYRWLNTTPPALIWSEMRKAYDHGARTAWIVNVGDIKPGELGMEFFLRMAWNVSAWSADAQPRFFLDFFTENFGPARAPEAAALLAEFYRLNFSCKPEHLPLASFNAAEKAHRLDAFARLVQTVGSTQAPSITVATGTGGTPFSF